MTAHDISHGNAEPTGHTGHDPHGEHPAHTAHVAHHHVTPSSVFLAVLIALLILTVVTVGASRIDFGSANLLIAMLIATVKASLVIAIFMHVKWDTAINRLVFLGSFLFLSLLLTFTLADQATRGMANPRNTIKAPVEKQWTHPSKVAPSNQ